MTKRKKYFVMTVDDESAAEFSADYDWEDPHSDRQLLSYIWNHNDFPQWTPKLEIEIYDDPDFNKLNDFIDSPIEKFCVSKRVKEVLEKFNLPKHKFYPVTVYRHEKILFGLFKKRKKVEAEYFAFHFDCHYISNTASFIDYSKTKTTKDSLGIDQTDEIFLNDTFDWNLDIFQIKMSWMTYVSEDLMNKLKEIDATRIEFSEINKLKWSVPRPNPKLTWD